MKSRIKRALLFADDLLARLSLLLWKESGGLVTVLFHSLFLDEAEVSSAAMDPQQGITVGQFRSIVEYFSRMGYIFVSPDDIRNGLAANHRYILVTFDDGYYNNIRALPILEEFNIPAVFFISTDHVDHGKSFWWDVVYRQLKRQGKSGSEVIEAVEEYKHLRTEEIEARLIAKFGTEALKPIADADRPFSVEELKEFCFSKHVILGNHTANHAILPNYSVAEIHEQIVSCQTRLSDWTGKTPCIIAYPNGDYSDRIIEEARSAGLELGITVEPGRNRVPVGPNRTTAMTLKRFIFWGNRSIRSQCRACHADVSLHRTFARAKRRLSASQLKF